MKSLSITSNGRLEKTAIYINGEQLSGIKELFLDLNEDGTFNSVFKYIGSDKNEYIKNIFDDELTFLQVTEPSFTDEELNSLQTITIESDGDINNAYVYWNEEEQGGIVSVFIHIKAPTKEKKSIVNLFGKDKVYADSVCSAEITFREEDDSLTIEKVF